MPALDRRVPHNIRPASRIDNSVELEPVRWIKEQESSREHYMRYVFSTTVVPIPPPWVGTDVEFRDAADECKHGRLAGDRTPPCGCHTERHNGDRSGTEPVRNPVGKAA